MFAMTETNSDSTESMSRRECLKWLARAATLATAGLVFGSTRLLADDKDDKKNSVKIAQLLAVKNESVQEIEKPNLILSRTAKGVACMSMYCTHKHNKLTVGDDGSICCTLHSSTFDRSGKATGGPAGKSLPWYQTEVRDNGDIYVNASKTIEQGQWAELPAWAKPKK
jgi:nitrite reductase/ring-hydroxylating ferredoxin subunit